MQPKSNRAGVLLVFHWKSIRLLISCPCSLLQSGTCRLFQNRGVASVSNVLRLRFVAMGRAAKTPNCELSMRITHRAPASRASSEPTARSSGSRTARTCRCQPYRAKRRRAPPSCGRGSYCAGVCESCSWARRMRARDPCAHRCARSPCAARCPSSSHRSVYTAPSSLGTRT